MTNLYRPSNRQRKTPLVGAFAALLFVAVVFGIDRIGGGVVREYARGAGGAARSLGASVQSAITSSGMFSSKSGLARENEELRRELAQRTEENARANYLNDENRALREMARLAEENPGITARVLSSLSSSPYGTFLIDAGTSDGVREGSVVLTEGGYVLGAVSTAAAYSATVQSLFAPGMRGDFRASSTAFSAEGRGGGNARAEVPRDSLVTVGSVVEAAAFGRPAGNVFHIESASSSAVAKLSIRIPVNLDTLRFVYVVSP